MPRLVAALIVVALGIGVWALWPRGVDGTTSTTELLAVSTTGVTSTSSTSTTGPKQTRPTGPKTTTPGDHVVTSVEEAEEILRELWFGWFDGIYHQDEERIREVVGSQEFLDAARAAFGDMEFVAEPTRDGIDLQTVKILFSDEDCLSVWNQLDVSAFRGPGSQTAAVQILRRLDGSWAMTAAWVYQDDLWEPDCEAQLESLS